MFLKYKTLVSGTKLFVLAINGGKGKGSAFRAMFLKYKTLVSGTKLFVLAINGGKVKGSAFMQMAIQKYLSSRQSIPLTVKVWRQR